MRENSTKTVPFSIQEQKELEIRLALQSVYNSLTEKGYNPIKLLKILVQSYLKSSPKRGN